MIIKTDIHKGDKLSTMNDLAQNQEGWARPGRGNHKGKSNSRLHYFIKGNSLSLCGHIRIVSSRIVFYPKSEDSLKTKCQKCENILKMYNNLSNLFHNIETSSLRGCLEW